jgi:hypothetical protein
LHILQKITLEMPEDIQSTLFRHLLTAIPPHLSLVEEVSALLEVSRDSAYRRLRGDTPLSIQEAHVLCLHFDVSLDALVNTQKSGVNFLRIYAPSEATSMHERLKGVAEVLDVLDRAQDKEIVYCSMELPFFHMMQVPELMAFKLYYWQLMDNEAQQKIKFSLESPAFDNAYSEIVNLYLRIPSTEIIYEAALGTTMNQILFFMESGHFERPADGIKLFDALHALVEHMKVQATLGRKFRFGAPPPAMGPTGNFSLFYNEMIYSQSVAYIRAEASVQVFLEYNVLDFLRTSDPTFCQETLESLNSVMRKSIPISSVSERERNKYFNRLDSSVARMRTRAEMILAGG